MKTIVKIKRVYDPPLKQDGFRILVDRLWPRGLTKEGVLFDAWAKALAPSTALRKWYRHDPALWTDFQKEYGQELKKNKAIPAFVAEYKAKKVITLLYAAKDNEHTHALVLRDFLEKQFSEQD